MSEQTTSVGADDDIAELRAELEDLRLRMALVVESVDGGVWEYDVASGTASISPLLKRTVALDATRRAPEDWRLHVHPDDLARLRKSREDVLAGRAALYSAEYRVRAPDGSYRWILTRGRLVRDAGGKPLRLIGLDIDVTERRRVEEALRASEQRFRDIAESASDWVWETDAEHRFTFFSERLTELTGMGADCLGKRRDELAAGAVAPGDLEAHLADLAARRPFRGFTYWTDTPAGRRCFSISGKPVFDAAGVFLGYRGTGTDITARKQAETERSETERRIADIAANLPGVIYRRVLHADGRVSYPYISDGIEELIGFEPRQFASPMTFEDLARYIPADDLERAQQTILASAVTLEPYSIEGRLIDRHGKIRWIRSITRPHRQDDGTVVWDGVALDITEQKRGELALQERTRSLETLNRINTALAAELDLDKLLQAVIDAGIDLTGAAFGAFYNVAGRAGEAMGPSAVAGLTREAFAALPMPQGALPFGPGRGKEAIRIDDIAADPRFGGHAAPPDASEAPPLRSYLAVPVVARSGKVVGGLVFGHAAAGVFTQRAEYIATGIATQAAIAIDNARLYRAAQDELRERKRAEERQKLLMAELDHRVKNTLAAVQSVASLTLSADPLAETFKGRLAALAHAHSLLAESRWEGARLRALIAEELAPYRTVEARQIVTRGREVLLTPKAAQTVALTMHELATNAAKYGALSVPEGRVEIAWRIATVRGERRLLLRWSERDGPPVESPPRRGFGSRLIEQSLDYDLGGSARLEFRPEGLRCEIDLPLDSVAAARE